MIELTFLEGLIIIIKQAHQTSAIFVTIGIFR